MCKLSKHHWRWFLQHFLMSFCLQCKPLFTIASDSGGVLIVIPFYTDSANVSPSTFALSPFSKLLDPLCYLQLQLHSFVFLLTVTNWLIYWKLAPCMSTKLIVGIQCLIHCSLHILPCKCCHLGSLPCPTSNVICRLIHTSLLSIIQASSTVYSFMDC